MAFQRESVNVIPVFMEVVLKSGLMSNDKKDLLRTASENGIPGFYVAMENGSTECAYEFMVGVLESNALGYNQKIELLIGVNKQNGNSSFKIAMENEHIECSKLFITEVLESAYLDDKTRGQLLSGQTEINKMSCLCMAMEKGDRPWVDFFVNSVLNSSINIDVKELLVIKQAQNVSCWFFLQIKPVLHAIFPF